jgi:hypothetical protein
MTPGCAFRGIEDVSWIDVTEEPGPMFFEMTAALLFDENQISLATWGTPTPHKPWALNPFKVRHARARLAALATHGARGVILTRADTSTAGAPADPPVTAAVGESTITCLCVPREAKPPPAPGPAELFERRVEAAVRLRHDLEFATERQRQDLNRGGQGVLTPDILFASPASLLGVNLVWLDAKAISVRQVQKSSRREKLAGTARKYGSAFGSGAFIVDDTASAAIPLSRFEVAAAPDPDAPAVYMVGVTTLERDCQRRSAEKQ